MKPNSAIKLGVLVQQHGFLYPQIKVIANYAEQLGFHSLWVWDHFFGPLGTEKPDQEPLLEPWTTLSALAETTSRLRLGTLATSISYRPPPLLAKITSSLDHISDGRVELGIGAGWYRHEYEAYGYPFPPIATRMQQLREGIQIIKAMWTERDPSFSGQHFHVTKASNDPKPIQRPHPPIWVCGWGQKLLLRVVAQEADGYNTGWLSIPDYRGKIEALKAHCADVKRNYKEIRLSYVGNLRLWRGSSKKDSSVAGNFTGTPQECCEQVLRYAAEGIELIILGISPQNPEALEVFGEEVLPSINPR